MQEFANYWWVYLAISAFLFLLTLINQAFRVRRLVTGDFGGVYKGIVLMVLTGVGSWVSFALFLVAAIYEIAHG